MASPLNQIDETVDRLSKRNLSPKQFKLETESISYSTRKIKQVINSLNTILHLEDGTFEPTMKPLNLYELVNEIISHHYSERIKKSLQIDNHISMDTEILGDKLLFYTMLSELYSNALEACPRGTRIAFNELISGQHVEITLLSSSTVDASIRDTFFNKYITHGKKLGTGLGTYAAKLIIEACHGKIQLEAKENETKILILFQSSTPAES